jgi:hypothetical protein
VVDLAASATVAMTVWHRIVWFSLGFLAGVVALWLAVTLTVGWYVYVPILTERDRSHYASLGCEPQIIASQLWMKCPRRLYWFTS